MERRFERGIPHLAGSLARFHGGDRFSEAAFEEGRDENAAERHVLETAPHVERARAERHPRVGARQPETELGVPLLVRHGLRRVAHEVRRRAQGEQLEGEARKRSDRRVLHQRGVAPWRGERSPQLRRDALEVLRGLHRFSPISSAHGFGHEGGALDEKRPAADRLRRARVRARTMGRAIVANRRRARA